MSAIFSAFALLFALPAFAHGTDFAGASLVARAPSETMIAALIEAELHPTNTAPAQASDMSTRSDSNETSRELPGSKNLPKIELEAWRNYGRGIVLSKWNFPRASFNDATMAKIRFDYAVLTRASFDRANLILADFSHTHAEGASFRAVEAPSAVMQHANLTKTNFADANLSCADLTDSDLTGANLRGSDLTHANKNLPCANKELRPEAQQQPIKTAQRTDPPTTSSSVPGGGGQQGSGTTSEVAELPWDSPEKQEYCKDKHPPKLIKAHLEGAHLQGADLACADFRGAYFDETTEVIPTPI